MLRSERDTVTAKVSAATIDEYQRNGAVCLRQIIEPRWLDVLAKGIEKNLSDPGPLSRVYTKDQGDLPGFFFGDVDRWRVVPEYEQFLFESRVAQIAGLLTGASTINIYFDGVFVRNSHTPSRTPWHQDVPYWPIRGDQMCSVWIPLDTIPLEGSVQYVCGSHRWNKVFRPKSFYRARDDYEFHDDALLPMPDFELLQDDYELLSWAMEPGDVQCFHGHIVHGAPGNQTDTMRRTFQARLAGDDMFYAIKDGDMHPTFPDCGLADGDRIDGPYFPELWRAESGS